MKTSFEGKKLYAVIISFLLIITFFITFHIIRNHYKHVFKNVITENTLTAHLLSSLMYEHQKAAISILESYAQRPLFIDALKKKDFHRAFYHLKSLSAHHTEIDALFITDKSGTLWANYPLDSKGFGKNLADRDWYKGVSKKWRPYISSVYRLIVLEKGLAVAVSVPVFDRKGKVIGILGGAQRTAFLDTFIKDNIIDPEKNITLLDQEGNIIFSNAVPYQEKITKYPDAHVLEKALAGVFIDMEIADAKEKGSISYVSIAPVRGIGWSVIVGQEKKAILKSLSGYFTSSAAIGFVIFFFLTFCLFYFRREYKYAKAKEIIQAEEKCRNIIENAAEGIYQISPEGRIITANPAAARILGYDSPEELISTITDVGSQIYAYSEDRDKAVELMRKYGFIKDYNVRCRRKNGSLIWVSFNVHIVRDDQGSILYNEGTSQDITARKQAEEALSNSQKKYRNIFENATEGIFQSTPEGRYISVNPAFARIGGYNSPDEMIDTVTDIQQKIYVHQEDRARLLELLNKQDRVENFEAEIRRKDNTIVWISMNVKAIRDQGEKIILLEGTIEDITERKRFEEALKVSDAQYRLLAEHMTDIVWMMNLDLNITWLSPSAMKARGFSMDEITALPLDRQLTPESLGKAVNWLGKLMRLEKDGLLSETDGILSRELEFYCKDGRTIVLDCTFQFIRDEQGKATGILAEGKDITARKQVEEKLRTYRLQLRALATRLQMIREEERAMIAREIHDEMGGGLTGLKMDLSWLLRKMSNADSGKERVALMDKIHTSNVLIDHMIHIVRRISADLRPPILDDLGLIAALEWQLSEFTNRTEIPHEFTTTFERVNMEEDTAIAVFRIFQEALTNVVRYSGATKVIVLLREGERSLFGDESFILEIRDNGRGITEEEILNPESLGLLGMKERVLAFGGELSIRGESGGGTVLVLKIPRTQGEAS